MNNEGAFPKYFDCSKVYGVYKKRAMVNYSINVKIPTNEDIIEAKF